LKVKLSYQTLQMPPPYAMAYTIAIDIEEAIHVDLNIEYLDREEIDEEEIINEGFGLDDDFQWKGQIPNSWKQELISYFDSINLVDKSHDLNHWLFVELDTESKKSSGHIAIPEKELSFLQQIIQACYEKGKRELPLSIDLITISNGEKNKFQIKASFAERSFSMNEQQKSWSDLEKIMFVLYSEEPEPSKPSKNPSKNGIWIDYTSEGYFYKLQPLSKDNIASLNQIIS
jgi:hypothetical protein